MSETTAVVPKKSLEERLRDRLHEQLGDLITPEDLKAMVDRGIEEVLFKPRVEPGNWHNSYKPSLVQELVDKHLKSEMQQAIEQWIKENPARMETLVQGAVSSGAGAALLTYLDYRFGDVFKYGIMQMRSNGTLPPATGV